MPEKIHLTIVGAGHASCQLLRHIGNLRTKSSLFENIVITVINEYPYSIYSGMVPGVLAKQYQIHQAMLDIEKLVQYAGGHFVLARAKSIDWEHMKVICEDTSRECELYFDSKSYHTLEDKGVRFDVLVVDVGSSSKSVKSVKGVLEYAVPTRPIAKLTQRIEAFEKRFIGKKKNLRVCVIGAGAAGIELACCLKNRFSMKGEFQTEVTIVDNHKRLDLALKNDALANKVKSSLDSMQIKLLMGFQATFVDDGALFLNTGKLIPFDLLIWAAGADPPDFIGHMGLPLDEYGFLKVTNTLQSIKRSNIFGAGDCVSVGDYDLPKAGVYAVREGPILCKNVVNYLKNLSGAKHQMVPYSPQSHFLKLLNLGNRTAIGEWYGWVFRGKIMWWLKDYIDRKFINSFRMCLVDNQFYKQEQEKTKETAPLLSDEQRNKRKTSANNIV